MKLFTKYLRINLLATLLIFLLASMAFYFLLWYVTIRQVDEDLKIEQREIQTYVKKYNRPPEPINVKDQSTSFKISVIKEPYRNFSTVPSPDKAEPEDFRQINFTLEINGQWLLFRVSKSLESVQNLNRSIVLISLVTIIAILLVSLLINRWQLGRLWKPFYITLDQVEKFRLGEKEAPQFEKTSIDEFDLLNSTVNHFIREAEKEYFLLKEFTENASHELQTPLSIVQSTLDVLIQDENISETQSNALQTAYSAIQKMSKLNHSLLLLNKIENRQFADTHRFDFKTLVEQKMADWQELWQGRSLETSSSLHSTPVNMNEQLAEVLLNNLFSNAARHSAEGGTVFIKLEEQVFEISNTANNGALDLGKLFKRFSKAGQLTDQHGLGLAIIKQIADISGKTVSYHYADSRHFFSIQL
jgi:two-component system, OmpR family, sensor histidine kinase QseC